MKKQLQRMVNNEGFYLPFVLTVTAFVLMFLATFIYIYQNDLVISTLTLQQIEAETFIQMSRQEFLTSEFNSELPSFGVIEYVYPTGEVTLEYEQNEGSEWVIDCSIMMNGYDDNIEARYTIPIN